MPRSQYLRMPCRFHLQIFVYVPDRPTGNHVSQHLGCFAYLNCLLITQTLETPEKTNVKNKLKSEF